MLSKERSRSGEQATRAHELRLPPQPPLRRYPRLLRLQRRRALPSLLSFPRRNEAGGAVLGSLHGRGHSAPPRRARRLARPPRGGRPRARASSIESDFHLVVILRTRRDAVDRQGHPVHSAGRLDLLSQFDPRRKVMSWAALVAWRERQRGRVVFTNGVFDLLHPG